MAIILKNATFVNHNTFEFVKTHILVQEEKDSSLIFLSNTEFEKKKNEHQVIECNNKYVTKSFACGHHHAYSALARGMGGPLKSPSDFHENLKYLWWALDKSLDLTSIKASAYATAIACIKNGVSFVIDHHASPHFSEKSLTTIADVFEEAGINHLLCFEISDRDGSLITEKAFSETADYLSSRQGLVGLHASFTVNDNTLKKAVSMAEKYNTGIHIHTAEDLCDQKDSIKKYGKRVVERLNDFGVLNLPASILVHCLHLDNNERDLIAARSVTIAQNIESNLNNNVGIFNGKGLNGNIMLGTDGMHSNMLRSFKAAYIYGQTSEQISMQDAYSRLRHTHQYLKKQKFKGDGENNLMLIDYESPTPVTPENFLAHLIFGIESSDITHLISNGKLIMKDRKLTNIDEDTINKFTQESAIKLWKNFKSQKV